MLTRLIVIAILSVWPAGAIAGPNANGTLIVHGCTENCFSQIDATDYCDPPWYPPFTNCEDAVTMVTGTDPKVWRVFAAFPEGSSPRLSALTFGIYYPEPDLALVGQGSCGADFEIFTDNWPNSGEGTALYIDPPLTELLNVIYWFGGYNYTAGSPVFSLGPHPTQGGVFADDSVPAELDPIIDFGRLGFDTEGYLPCPAPPVPTLPMTWGAIKARHR